MAKKNEEKTIIEKIYDYTLEDIMGECFGRYSKSIIQDRALPDVRDGLKPVQRRILYTMWENKNTYDKPYRKCAKAVGDVMGKYHPHGDSSIYGAMIYMSQAWKMREIFIDIHGNNGSIDGDGPAAYRYTECRTTKLAQIMLKDINRNSVEMTLNYSDEDLEPTVLPANFPNLLVNGSTGISAGYATNIPPHNLAEVIDATIYRIDNSNCRLETILNIIKGPDFPTGGIIEGLDGIKQAFKTGKGRLIVSSKCEFQKNKGKEQIVITEIPFEVNKQLLVKKIDDVKYEKKIDGIAEVRDESDKESAIRIVIDLKPGVDKDLILKYLLKNTDLQTTYNYNMVCIDQRRPRLLGIIPIIDAYIDHQKDVITKRTKFDLDFAQKEMHITEGLVKAISILDEVIAVIRGSKNKQDAIQNLVKKWDFTEDQATAIVMLQLYRLTNTDVTVLMEKLENLKKIIENLQAILNDESKLKAVIKEELRRIKKEYGVPRKTEIKAEVSDLKIDEKELINKEDVILILTNDGYLKRVSLKSHNSNDGETALKPGDYVVGYMQTNTLNKLCIFTSLGNYLYIPIHEIPACKWKDLGKHISNIVTMNPDDKVVNVYVINESITNPTITFFTKNGMVKQTPLNDMIVSRYNKSYTAIKLKGNDEVVNVTITKPNVLIITKTGYYLNYKSSEIPVSGPKTSGVKGINLKDDEVISGVTYYDEDEYIDVFTNQGTAKRIKLKDLNTLSRAKRGTTLIKKVKTTNYELLSAFITNSKDTIGIKCNNDIITLKNSEIPINDLASTGSVITKQKLTKAFISKELKLIEDKDIELPKLKEETKELTIDDFIDDFKL